MSDSTTNTQNKIAFIFPGQGSQSLGMLSDYADSVEVLQTFEQASDALGYNVWQLCQQGPEDKLNQTDKTQPALLTASVALWRLWQVNNGTMPSIVAGHSLGEYSALICAGIMGFEQGVRLVEQRGLFMKQAVPAGVGKMAAIIGLDDDKVQAACDASAQNEIVSPVNYNSPGQIVIAGNASAVDRAMIACKESGAKRAMPLTVSVPSHSYLMKPASVQLEQVLNSITLSEPIIPVVNNEGVTIETRPDKIKQALVRQLYCPVRWSEIITFIAKQGVNSFVECGPGKVLSGLNRRIDRSLTSYHTCHSDSLNKAAEALSE